MAEHLYTLISIEREFYCAPSGHRMAGVAYRYKNRRYWRRFEIGNDVLINEHKQAMKIPAYFQKIIVNALLKTLQENVSFYEYDSDMVLNTRVPNQHDKEWIAKTRARLSGIVGDQK